jgi:flagellar basal-body rod protein FlgC
MTLPRVGLLPQLTNAPEREAPPTRFRPLDLASSGMTVQRIRLETAIHNIANAETTRTDAGGPYRRRVVRLEEVTREGSPPPFPPLPLDAAARTAPDPTAAFGGARVVAIEEDPTEGPILYDPGHPDADAAGYVRMPNVSITEEIIEIQEARRLYEANATVFQAARQLLRRALDI